MKTHYCKAEGVPISFKGECNWCGMKETHGFEDWYENNEKYIDPRDMKAWLASAWDAAANAERESIARMFDSSPKLMPYAQNAKGGCLACGFSAEYTAAVIRARSDK